MSLKFFLEPEPARQCVSVKTDPPLRQGVRYEIYRLGDSNFESRFVVDGHASTHRCDSYAAAQGHAKKWIRSKMRGEVPFDHGACSEALSNFIDRISRRPSCQLKYERIYDRQRPWCTTRVFGTVCVTINRIWVFGSFARGAEHCHDVDLIVDAELTWLGDLHWAQFRDEPPKEYRGVGDLKRRFYDLTPQIFGALRAPLSRASLVLYSNMFEDGHHFPFDTEKLMREEAVLVWSPGLDWKAAIRGIVTRPTGAAFPAEQRSQWDGLRFRPPAGKGSA